MLRGPQTLGELRGRTERLHKFDETSEVESVIEHMAELVVKLPRRPGEKEVRYAHLLSGEITAVQSGEETPREEPSPRQERIAALESDVALLRAEMEALKQQFAEFRKQFE
jgi:uncharacterized protein YceH (UPF0502 family)